MRDCVKLKTCLPSSSFCLAVLYSLGFATWPCCCACAVAPGSATARNEKANMDGDLMFDVLHRNLLDNQEKYIVNIHRRRAAGKARSGGPASESYLIGRVTR